MYDTRTSPRKMSICVALIAAAMMTLGGCQGGGPAIEALPQTISFSAPPEPPLNQGSVNVSATASSGLPVKYSSMTPSTCAVDSSTGVVTGLASGTCTVSANQSGDTRYAPAPQVTQDITFAFNNVLVFAPPPSLGLYDLATVTAIDSSGLPVAYRSATSSICSIDGTSGLVSALAVGDCTIVAMAGTHQASQTMTIPPPSATTVPGAPGEVRVTGADAPNTVLVSIGAVTSGGSPITGYSVVSSPSGVTASGATIPIMAICPSSCAGYGFSVSATNAVGTGPLSPHADIITNYNVAATFYEPDTQPNNSLFIGSFTFNATTGTVSNLRGKLSESMTGGSTPYPNDTMTWLPLNNQLSSVPVTLGGVNGFLVTTFLLNTTNTLSSDPLYGGTDGWSPGTGKGLYYGFPGANPGNGYVRIFVNSADPTAGLTQAQIDKLAYADCTPGGMMGASCMTGTTVAGYGTVGTMSGYPLLEAITRQ